MKSRAVAFLVLLAALAAVLLPHPAQATGVGVSPSSLGFEAHSPGSTSTLYVMNTGDEVSHYRVYAEGEYQGWFDISPGEFSLAPGQGRQVEITLCPPRAASGEHSASICVVSYEPSLGLQVGVGVKVPAHIAITGPPLPMIGIAAAVLAVLAVANLLVWRKKRRPRGVRA